MPTFARWIAASALLVACSSGGNKQRPSDANVDLAPGVDVPADVAPDVERDLGVEAPRETSEAPPRDADVKPDSAASDARSDRASGQVLYHGVSLGRSRRWPPAARIGDAALKFLTSTAIRLAAAFGEKLLVEPVNMTAPHEFLVRSNSDVSVRWRCQTDLLCDNRGRPSRASALANTPLGHLELRREIDASVAIALRTLLDDEPLRG